jgi:hypothetical protein
MKKEHISLIFTFFAKNACQCDRDLYNASSLTQQGLTGNEAENKAVKSELRKFKKVFDTF